jgi:hypothetical protein
MLIKHNVDINFSGGGLGVTPIYFACLNGHTDVVQIPGMSQLLSSKICTTSV